MKNFIIPQAEYDEYCNAKEIVFAYMNKYGIINTKRRKIDDPKVQLTIEG